VLSRPDHSLWPLFGLSLDHLTNIDTGNTHKITTPQDLGVVHLLTATFYASTTSTPAYRQTGTIYQSPTTQFPTTSHPRDEHTVIPSERTK
jgi:hypothetical protein